MSKIHLFVARHGETEFNKKGLLQGRGIDAPLNSLGRKQAKSLASYLSNYKSEQIISSSLKRSWQTAEPYQKKTGLTTLKKSTLDEMDFGDFEGVSFSEVTEELQNIQTAWERGETDLKIPGGESPREVYDRANCAVQSALGSFNGSTMVMVIHGRLIRILLSEWLGFGLRNMHRIEHMNGAVNHLTFQNGMFNAVYLNKISHL